MKIHELAQKLMLESIQNGDIELVSVDRHPERTYYNLRSTTSGVLYILKVPNVKKRKLTEKQAGKQWAENYESYHRQMVESLQPGTRVFYSNESYGDIDGHRRRFGKSHLINVNFTENHGYIILNTGFGIPAEFEHLFAGCDDFVSTEDYIAFGREQGWANFETA